VANVWYKEEIARMRSALERTIRNNQALLVALKELDKA
jgi:hypothetical protein